jgi:hypothetical protein
MNETTKELKDAQVGDLVIRTSYLKDAVILLVKTVTAARITTFDEYTGKEQTFRKSDGRVIGGLHDSWSVPHIRAASETDLKKVRDNSRKRAICESLQRKNWEWFSLETLAAIDDLVRLEMLKRGMPTPK